MKPYEPLALRAFAQIEAEASARWPSTMLGLHHRTGTVAIGEASVVIVAASAHRGDAFAVCRYAIERVKQIAPIWKHEYFEDGDAWVEGAVADPADATRRGRRRANGHARDGAAVRAAARARRRQRAGGGGRRRAPSIADVWRGLVDRHPALAPYAGSVSAAVNAEFAR